MHNCLILGSGRSGTSMVAGALARARYFMGDYLYAPRPSNPKGFFEDREVNAVNEAILSTVTPWTLPRFWPRRLHSWGRRVFFPTRVADGERWLARVPPSVSCRSSPDTDTRIRRLVNRSPYCFKDPRLCYTLPVWRPWLDDTRFVCIFRDPTVTVTSMTQELQTVPKLAGLKLTYADLLEVWRLMYTHILDIHSREGEWLFLHYDQVLGGSGLDRLAAFLDVTPDWTFPDPALRRTRTAASMPERISQVYERLCNRAQVTQEKRG